MLAHEIDVLWVPTVPRGLDARDNPGFLELGMPLLISDVEGEHDEWRRL
jgi:hypothetical protein